MGYHELEDYEDYCPRCSTTEPPERSEIDASLEEECVCTKCGLKYSVMYQPYGVSWDDDDWDGIDEDGNDVNEE